MTNRLNLEILCFKSSQVLSNILILLLKLRCFNLKSQTSSDDTFKINQKVASHPTRPNSFELDKMPRT